MISKLFKSGRSPELELADLTRLVRRYSVEQQQVPRDLVELVTLNYLKSVPIPPAGRKYIIDRKAVEVRLE